LHDIGKAHPQALIYPLTVASKSNVQSRKAVARSITAKMKDHSREIVEQAELVSTELIRAAILWHEIWYDGLEEASKHYYADGNIPGMFEVLEPLHDMVERVRLRFVILQRSWLIERDLRLCERHHSSNRSDTICLSLVNISDGTPCMETRRRSSKLGISTIRYDGAPSLISSTTR
jgi:hypothetical protein